MSLIPIINTLNNLIIITFSISLPTLSYFAMKEYNQVKYEKEKDKLKEKVDTSKLQLEIKETDTKINKANNKVENVDIGGMF